ncbi:hypothetical protein E2C01_077123 [Portunus trituberculatus]|uniref:Uncharacterized protein n=1 Tax=Portunus trituberculatus TaxID=210409 RepID=A0A5B7IJE5_PORTR|nr:hypothetical protein [Portunus trituberculatus]
MYRQRATDGREGGPGGGVAAAAVHVSSLILAGFTGCDALSYTVGCG